MLKLVLPVVFLFSFPCVSSANQVFDEWGGLLRQSITAGSKNGVALNLLDYPKVGSDPRFARTIESLAMLKPIFKNDSEKAAFWINTYNIFAIKLVVENRETEGIKNIGSFIKPVWKKKAGVVGGKAYSLDDIEHKILRKIGLPKIHAGIVCASVSCPDLRGALYTGERLSAELDSQFALLLANSKKGLAIDEGSKTVWISKIFKWFKDDFGGDDGVRRFIARYLPAKKAGMAVNPEFSIKYLEYDWALNSR